MDHTQLPSPGHDDAAVAPGHYAPLISADGGEQGEGGPQQTHVAQLLLAVVETALAVDPRLKMGMTKL